MLLPLARGGSVRRQDAGLGSDPDDALSAGVVSAKTRVIRSRVCCIAFESLVSSSESHRGGPMSVHPAPPSSGVDRARLRALLQREQARFAARNPGSATAYQKADALFGRVPMTWMNKTSAHFPLYLDRARGAHVTDIDGHKYVDFSLGDTGSMAGHSPAAVVTAVRRRVEDLGGLAVDVAHRAGADRRARFSRSVSACRAGRSRSPPRTRTAGLSGWPERSPAGRRSSSTATATTAPWTSR